VDIIPLQAYTGGVPLRFGNLVPHSEKVELNDVTLTAGTDYGMDYAVGVVYLLLPQHMGDTLIVTYQHFAGQAQTAVAAAPLNSFGFMPGASVFLGMGLTERQGTGTTVTSNVFGTQDALSFGSKTSLTGVVILSNQQASTNHEGFAFGDSATTGSPYGMQGNRDEFLVQKFNTALMGGSVTANVQQISRNFANFGAAKSAGFTDDQVKLFQAQAGLGMTELNFTNLKLGNALFSDGYREVQDQNGSVTQHTFAMSEKDLKMTYSDREVTELFQRFNDLPDADKAQMMKERGMGRHNFATEFNQKSGKLTISATDVKDEMMRSSLYSEQVAFDSTKYKFNMGREGVGEDFTRISDLSAPEIAMYQREVGTQRNWVSVTANVTPKVAPFTFNQLDMASPTGKLDEHDVAYTGKNWSIQHFDLASTYNYGPMSALQDAAVTNDVNYIENAFGVAKLNPADKGAFLGSAGLARNYTTVGGEFFKGWQMKFGVLDLKGNLDSGQMQTFSVTSSKLTLAFRDELAGSNLSEMNLLTPSEQTQWGTMDGVHKEDLNMALQVNKVTKLTATGVYASTPGGAADNGMVDYETKGFGISFFTRSVNPNFTTVGQLNDPNAGALAATTGFGEDDLKFNWTSLPKMKLTGEAQDAKDEFTGEYKSLRNVVFDWDVDKATHVNITDNATTDHTDFLTVFNNDVRQVTVTHDFGRFGHMSFTDESDTMTGANAPVASSNMEDMSYEMQISKAVSVKTEDSYTEFADGGHENLTAETVSTALTKRAGVSLTEVQVQNTEASIQDPAKTNYGAWYDLGGGVRISYGYAHQYTDAGSVQNTNLTVAKNPTTPTPDQYATLQPGLIGPFNFAGGTGANSFLYQPGLGNNHTQGFSDVNLTTAKPFKVGPFSNLKFNVGVNTASDYSAWVRSTQGANVTGNWGANSFALLYDGQLAPQGAMGIDKGFQFQTDQSPKSWLNATIDYKVRTLPGDLEYTIRNYNVMAKPMKNLVIQNQLQTDPEVAGNGMFLGSTPQAARSDKWLVSYTQGTDTTFGYSYQELLNGSNSYETTVEGLNLKMFQKSGSPVTIFFGEEDSIGGNLPHRLTSRYTIEFDQRPGPRQTMSLFFGNVAYDYGALPGVNKENWTVRCNYQVKF